MNSEPRRLRVFVNAISLGMGGGGTYIVEQLAALAVEEGVELTVLAKPDVALALAQKNAGHLELRTFRPRGLIGRLLHEQLVLAMRARSYDVLYQPGGFAMFLSPVPQVVSNQNPHHFGKRERAFWRGRYPWKLRLRLELEWRFAHASVRRAEAFVTASDALLWVLKEDMGSRANVLAIRSAAPALEGLGRASGTGSGGYALAVAHDYLHKDWDGLVETFLRHEDLPPLILVGRPRDEARLAKLTPTSGEGRLAKLTQKIEASGGRERVTLLGGISDRGRIADLYEHAACFVAHSYLEAGPLTPREALSTGLRVVASDIRPHREAAGSAAFYYDPADLDGLADAVRKAIGTDETPPAAPRLDGWTWAENAAAFRKVLSAVAAGELPTL